MQRTGVVTASTANYAALSGRQLAIPAGATVDLGARYRFEIGGAPMSARVQLANAFDVRRPALASGNAFTLPDTRRVSLQLTGDF